MSLLLEHNAMVEAAAMQETRPDFMNLDASKSTPVSDKRLVHLDGVRGFAVMLVFFVHLHPLFSRFLMQNSVLYSFSDALGCIGNAGVDLFFLLSGYLIYGVVLKHSHTYASFLWRRISRIYPTFIFIFALYLVLGFLFPRESKLYGSAPEKFLYVGANFFLLPGIFPIKPIITVAWSLSYEFFFYLLIPLIVHLALLRKMSTGQRALLFAGWWVLGTIVLRSVGMQRLQMFSVGILIYELSQLSNFRKRLSAAGEYFAAITLLVGLTCAYFLFVPTSELVMMRSFGRYLAFPCMSLSFFCFGVYALLYSGFFRRGLSWLPMRLLGRASYSYYLIHGLTLKMLALVLASAFVNWKGDILFCIVSVSGFLLTCLTAALLFIFVEEPLSLRAESRLLLWWHAWRSPNVTRISWASFVADRRDTGAPPVGSVSPTHEAREG